MNKVIWHQGDASVLPRSQCATWCSVAWVSVTTLLEGLCLACETLRASNAPQWSTVGCNSCVVGAQVVCSLHQQGGGWDSGALAAHLERLARKAELPEAWQLALDMYARLGMHDKRCQMLLAKVNCLSVQAYPLWHCYKCMQFLERDASCLTGACLAEGSSSVFSTALGMKKQCC